ncbi:MAG TPA: glycosyltransferase [Solirubrobacterales bacterium]|jgi:glycosyltransferase involved in cell wall biosynthesis
MGATPPVTISAVVAAYQAEKWIADAIDSILGQTSPPDEVIVVDDGSTDGTGRELGRFGDRIRVIRRENGGCPAAFNTAFAAVRSDFVAMCGADDIWEPHKLELQRAAITAHPEADLFCGHAVMTGLIEGDHTRPPGIGVLDNDALRDELFAEGCVINAPSIVIRRELFERLGPFIEDFGADDYEYWFRALRAGARFYYEPRPLVRWRQHGENLSWKTAWMDECTYKVLRSYEGEVKDRRVRARGYAPLFFRVGRGQVDAGEAKQARRSFARSLRHWRGQGAVQSARALAWIVVLSLPARLRDALGATLVKLKRAIDSLLGTRQPLRA